MELLKPLSCQPMAAARLAGAPCCAAMLETCPPSRRTGVGSGLAFATTVAGAGSSERAGAGAPVGSLMTVPARRKASGSSPFICAMAVVETPAWAARPDSVSPTRTV